MVTLQDIANELNLSKQTVSRSLRNDRLINPDTRARVSEAAQRLGYTGRVRRPRRPVERDTKTGTLGLLVRFRNMEAARFDGNLMRMMAGIMAVADEQRMQLKTYTRHSERRGEEHAPSLPGLILEGECQALIAHGEQDETEMAFLARRLPVVSIGRIYEHLPLDAAVADNARSVRALVEHLATLGHRRLAWVGPDYSATFMEEREDGFIRGCRKYGLECHHPLELSKEDSTVNKALLLGAMSDGVTGFVCGNDTVALTVLRLLEEAGQGVPENVSVTGFDAWLWVDCPHTRRATTIDPNFYEIGKAAAQMALQRLAYPMDEPRIVSVRGKLVLGDTTAPPPQRAGH